MNTKNYLGVSTEGFHQIAYSEWGHPDPTQSTVICSHGFQRNKHDFDALADYLSKQGRHVFCPDTVGRGKSDWLQKPQHYTFEQYIADMTALIARTTATQIDWIGTSMGGLIGMMMASVPNSPIKRLVLNDISPQIPIQGLRRLSKYTNTGPTFSNQEEAKHYLKIIYASFGNLSEAQWDTFTENSVERNSSGMYVATFDPNIAQSKTKEHLWWELVHHPHKALEGILFDIDLWSIWLKIKCPVLIIHGLHSDILLPEHIAKMQRTHPNTDLMVVENAGHAPALLDLAEHKKIGDWLNKTQLGPVDMSLA